MTLVLVALLLIGFIVAFAIGSNDETMSPAVGAGVFTVKVAVLLGAIINLIGAVFMGGGVSEKVGSDLVNDTPLTTTMVFAILISMAIWLLAVSASKGLPISTTQCIVGSVIGVAFFAAYIGATGWTYDSLNTVVIFEIILSWLVSPVVGFVISASVFSLVRRVQKRATGLAGRERQERLAAYGLVIFLLLTSLSRGGNDVANAVAPLIALPDFQQDLILGPFIIPGLLIPLLVGGIGMAIGLIVVGGKVIKTLATEVVTLSPSSALSASISVSLVLFIGTYLGFPLSGTHVLVAALIAVGWVSNHPVKTKQIKNILISWIVTVPVSALLGIAVFASILFIFPI